MHASSGTRNAAARDVRAFVVIFCAACAGSMRPAVIPKLSELPTEREQRNGILDQSHAEPSAEQQPVSKKARKVETAAATAAAVIGVLFSKSSNVTLGAASAIDENALFERRQQRKRTQAKDGDDDNEATPAEPDVDTGTLVPWVRLDSEPTK
jgi:hypothetical protein